jgi:hypothetical protein
METSRRGDPWKKTRRGSERVAKFPEVQEASRGDSNEVLVQMQGKDSKGVGHFGRRDEEEEE